MKKFLSVLFSVVLLLGVALTGVACKSTTPSASDAGAAGKTVKVGYIYVGSASDGGYSYAQDQGRLYVEKELKVETKMIENVPEGADCKTAMENLIKDGCNIIFATSYGYMDYVDELAKKYPDVVFEHCSGDKKNDTNFGNYFGREYQARYLAGIAAGKATKSNQIGYVAAMQISECIRGINAFTLGVRSVNPTATVNVVWTNTWYDPQVEKQAAESLLAQGCDVMAQHQDTSEPVAAAEAAGAFSTCYNSSMKDKAPKGYLTGPIWNWGPYMAKIVKSVQDGTYKPVAYWGGLETGTIVLDEYGPSVTDETKGLIEAAAAKLKDHSWDVFYGPIKDQSGAVKIADGAKLTDAEMLSIDWFVEGVVGSTK